MKYLIFCLLCGSLASLATPTLAPVEIPTVTLTLETITAKTVTRVTIDALQASTEHCMSVFKDLEMQGPKIERVRVYNQGAIRRLMRKGKHPDIIVQLTELNKKATDLYVKVGALYMEGVYLGRLTNMRVKRFKDIRGDTAWVVRLECATDYCRVTILLKEAGVVLSELNKVNKKITALIKTTAE